MHIVVSSFVFISTMLALFGKDWTHIRYLSLECKIFVQAAPLPSHLVQL